MGQIVTGILYGCEVPRAIDSYEALDSMYDSIKTKLKFTIAPDSDPAIMGFFMAIVGDVDEYRGARNIRDEHVELANLETWPEMLAAQRSWQVLLKWMLKKFPDVTLNPPSLWLVPAEIA